MEIDQRMADRLRQARKLAGYNTVRAATDAHRFVYQTYAAHENGSRPFKREAARYAAAFRVNLIWLVNGTGNPRGRDQNNPAAELYDSLPPDRQALALEMLRVLKTRA